MCPDLEKTNRGFNGVHFMVDTRFMIKALDLDEVHFRIPSPPSFPVSAFQLPRFRPFEK